MRVRSCALLLIVVAGCKPNAIEAALSHEMTEMGLHAAKVTCPGDGDGKPGQVLTCQVALEAPAPKQARTYALDVKINGVTDGKPDLHTAWHDGPAVETAKAESVLVDVLDKELGGPLILTCGAEPLAFLDSAHKLHCTLTAGEVKTKAIFDFDPKTLKHTAWQLDPPLLAKAKLEAVLAPVVHQKVPDDVVINCGSEVFLPRPADGVITCRAIRGTESVPLKLEVDENLNLKSWEISK